MDEFVNPNKKNALRVHDDSSSSDGEEKPKKVTKQSAELEAMKATHDALEDDITNLGKELGELNESLEETTKRGLEEKTENLDTIEKAEEGMGA